MGLIRAASGAFGGTLADQWKEYFYCDSLSSDILAAKGEKKDFETFFQYKGRGQYYYRRITYRGR